MALTYVGTVLAGPGLFLARHDPSAYGRYRVGSGAAAFLGAALVTGSLGLLILSAFFWLCEGLPSPLQRHCSEDLSRRSPGHDHGCGAGGHVGYPTGVGASGRMGPGWTWLPGAFPGCRDDRSCQRPHLRAAEVQRGELRLRQRPSIRHFRGILVRDKRYSVYLGAVVLFGLSALVPSAIIPLVQVDRLHITYTELGWLSLALSLVRMPATSISAG